MVKDKIIILGASGFIGMHLCRELINQKFKVIALVRDKQSKQAKKIKKMGIEIISTGNLFIKKKLNHNFIDIKYLINLAALAHIKTKNNDIKKLSYINNIEKNIINNFKNKRLKIIHISTAKVNRSKIFKGQNTYTKLKYNAERIIRKNYKNHVILRPPLVYGPYVKANFLTLMKAIKNNIPLPFKKLEKKRSYMYVENLTDAIIYILKKNYFKGKTYNINDGCIITNEELVSIIANYLDKKVTLFYFPPSILKYIFKFFGSIEIFNKVMEEFIVSNKKFVLDTGWKPKYHYTYGIKKTCLWYKRKFTI